MYGFPLLLVFLSLIFLPVGSCFSSPSLFRYFMFFISRFLFLGLFFFNKIRIYVSLLSCCPLVLVCTLLPSFPVLWSLLVVFLLVPLRVQWSCFPFPRFSFLTHRSPSLVLFVVSCFQSPFLIPMFIVSFAFQFIVFEYLIFLFSSSFSSLLFLSILFPSSRLPFPVSYFLFF